MKARILQTAAVVLVLALALPAGAASRQKEAAAEQAARRWLAQVDQGHYDASWRTASEYFKQVISEEHWRRVITGVRRPLGRVLRRKLKSRTYRTELPGAPDGDYVVIEFDSVFENKRAAGEMVTPKRDSDGVWRVTGYYIK